MFDIMWAHQLKMNPTKLFLRVSSGKFFGFIITSKGIHLDPDKVKAIQGMQPLKTLTGLRGLQGKFGYIRRFIANLLGRCQLFTRLIKKGVSFIWDQACQKAFEDIKEYLTKSPVLVAFISGKSFLLYVRAMDHSLGTFLAQRNNKGCEHAIYYLSRTLIGAESRYNPIEKEYLALVFAVQKTRHYLVDQTIHFSRVNPLRILMTKSGSLNSRLANWVLLLFQYDMIFVP